MTLHEPSTFATDVALAALAGGLGWRLRFSTRLENSAARWWSRAFFLTALSAIIGGSYHGFSLNFSATIAGAWWRCTLLTIDLVSAAMATSWVYENVPLRHQRTAFAIVALKLAAFTALALRSPLFVVAISDYGTVIIAWGLAAIVLRRKWSSWMLVGLALSLVSAMVQQFRWAPAAWFNHNDLYHLIQMLALVAFYRSARLFERPTP